MKLFLVTKSVIVVKTVLKNYKFLETREVIKEYCRKRNQQKKKFKIAQWYLFCPIHLKTKKKKLRKGQFDRQDF